MKPPDVSLDAERAALVAAEDSAITLCGLRACATGLSGNLALFFAQLELLLRRAQAGTPVGEEDALRLLELARREFLP